MLIKQLKKIYSDRFIDKLLIISYFIYQLFFVISVSAFVRSNSMIYKLVTLVIIISFLIIILCTAYYFFRGLYTKNEIIISVLIGMILLISFYNYHSVMVMANIFAILAFKKFDAKKVIKIYLYATIIGFLINIFLGLFTIYSNDTPRILNDMKRMRYGLGFFYTSFGPFYFTSIVLAYIYIRDKIKLYEYVIAMLIDIILFILTDTKAAFFYVLLSLVLHYIFTYCKKNFLYNIFSIVAILSYSLFFAVAFFLSLFYDSNNKIFILFNKILSGRLGLTNNALQMYGFKVFGQNVPIVNGGATHVDSSMISMLMLNGLTILLISLIFMTYFTYITYKTKNISLLIALFIIAFRSSFDLGFMALQLSPFVVAFLPTFYEYKDIKNNVYSNDNNYI